MLRIKREIAHLCEKNCNQILGYVVPSISVSYIYRSPIARTKNIRFNTLLHKIYTTPRVMRRNLPKRTGLLIRDRVIAVHRFESYTLRHFSPETRGFDGFHAVLFIRQHVSGFLSICAENMPFLGPFLPISAQNLHKICTTKTPLFPGK